MLSVWNSKLIISFKWQIRFGNRYRLNCPLETLRLKPIGAMSTGGTSTSTITATWVWLRSTRGSEMWSRSQCFSISSQSSCVPSLSPKRHSKPRIPTEMTMFQRLSSNTCSSTSNNTISIGLLSTPLTPAMIAGSTSRSSKWQCPFWPSGECKSRTPRRLSKKLTKTTEVTFFSMSSAAGQWRSTSILITHDSRYT